MNGADIVTIGRGALANPDLPRRIEQGASLNAFDPSILGPIANIKQADLQPVLQLGDGLGHRWPADIEMPRGGGNDPVSTTRTKVAMA